MHKRTEEPRHAPNYIPMLIMRIYPKFVLNGLHLNLSSRIQILSSYLCTYSSPCPQIERKGNETLRGKTNNRERNITRCIKKKCLFSDSLFLIQIESYTNCSPESMMKTIISNVHNPNPFFAIEGTI